MKTLELKLVKVIQYPDRDDPKEQLAFVQIRNGMPCLDISTVETEQFTREQFTEVIQTIVKAVNSHYELLEALKVLTEYCQSLRRNFSDEPDNSIKLLVEKAKQAIQNAQ